MSKPSNDQFAAATAGVIGALGYAGTWVSVTALGFSVNATPLGNSGWGTVWFVALLVGAALVLVDFALNTAVLTVAAVGSIIFGINFLVNYYGLPNDERVFASFGWGFFAAAIGSLAALLITAFYGLRVRREASA